MKEPGVIVRLMLKYGLTLRQARWASVMSDQLDRCKDDSARRILLGIGERFEESHED